MRRVVLVCGPPCAGKTTHVTEHAQPGDLILDADTIGEIAMRQRLDQVAAMTHGTAWVIRCCPGPTQRDALAAQIAATETLLLYPDLAELLARARRRPHPQRHITAIRKWIDIETGKTPASTGTADPAPRPRTQW